MENFRNGITVSLTAAAPIAAPLFGKYMISKYVFPFVSVSMLLLVTVAIACISYFLLPNLLYRCYFIRCLFDPLARYEGAWIHIINMDSKDDTKDKTDKEEKADDRVCGFCYFTYNKFDKSYLYTGENYNDKGMLVTSFVISDVQYAQRINGFRCSGSVKKTGDTEFSCYGEVAFMETGTKKVSSAHGLFTNNSKVSVRGKFIAERIKYDNEKEYDFDLQKHRAKFALEYYRKHRDFIDKLASSTDSSV